MAARRKKSQDDAPGGPGHARRGRRRAYPLDPLDGEPATLPPPSQRDCFVPAADTVPNPPGKSESTSSQWYPQEIDGLNKLCRGFTHYFGVKISHSLVQRAFLWVLLTSGPALLTRVFHQIERLYWEDHRRYPGPDDKRRARGKGKGSRKDT